MHVDVTHCNARYYNARNSTVISFRNKYRMREAKPRSASSLGVILAIVAALSTSIGQAAEKTPYLADGWHDAPPPSRIRYMVFKDNVSSLLNMSKDCRNGDLNFRGVVPIIGNVIKRSYKEDAVTIRGVVIEKRDGERVYINIDTIDSLVEDSVDMANSRWIIQGINSFLRNGNSIEGSAHVCGGTSDFFYLDSLHLAGVHGVEPDPSKTVDNIPQATQQKQRSDPNATAFADPQISKYAPKSCEELDSQLSDNSLIMQI